MNLIKLKLVTNCDHLSKLKYSKALPFAFSEHGTLMAASVLNSKRASDVSVFIIRAFVKIRKMISQNKELEEKFIELEQKLSKHDKQLIQIISAIKQLLNPEKPKLKKRIGF